MPVHAVDLSTLVVAIDGPSGSGKSTVARGVARILGLRYLDTGAMYRALTWWVIEQGVDPADESSVLAAATTFDLDMSTDPVAQQVVLVSGHDVTRAIRSAAVTQQVSAVSAVAEVRRQLVARQRVIIGAGGIVVEGRDIGTTVCPAAPVKIFLTAATEARAVRRGWLARMITPEKRAKVERLFARHGQKIVLVARFLPGVRAVASFTAGSAGMSYARFVLFDGVAALASAPLLVYLGYRFGNRIHLILERVKEGQLSVVFTLLAVGLFSWLWKRARRARAAAAAVKSPVSTRID